MRETTEIDGLLLEVNYDAGGLTTSTLTGNVYGREIIARANARWNPVDEYDRNIGKAISYYRAVNRFARKAEKALIKSLDKGE